MKILITGKNGQMGYELAHIFAQPGNEIFALDRSAMDLSNAAQIREVTRAIAPDLILNAAAYTSVDLAEKESALAFAVNADAPAILAEEANRLGAPIVHYSTDYVFDGNGKRPYQETDAVGPTNVYGHSKLKGEAAIASIAKQHLILRASWLYSNRRHNFLLTMLRLAAERDTISVVNDQLGSPTWVRHVSSTTQALVNHDAALLVPNGVYHLTASGVTSWHGFAAAIIDNVDAQNRRAKAVLPISSDEYKAPAKRPAYSVLDNGKIEAALKQKMSSWESQLSACLDERKILATAGG